MKTCTKCGESKKDSCFYIRTDSAKETYSHCKDCVSQDRKERYKREDKVQLKENQSIRNQSIERRFQKIKYRSLKKILGESDLSIEQYQKIISCPCHYCANKLGLPVQIGIGLDRLNPNLGYLLSNVVSCCEFCNSIKSDIITPEEMIAIAKLLINSRSNFIPQSLKINRTKRLVMKTITEPKIISTKLRQIKLCPDCSVSISRQASYCRECNNKRRTGTHTTLKINWPSIEDMIILINKSNRAQVARDLGISYNTLTTYLINNGINPKSYSKQAVPL